ncbi:MAG: SPOR domain-containing protein [Pseudomonadota bacterium]
MNLMSIEMQVRARGFALALVCVMLTFPCSQSVSAQPVTSRPVTQPLPSQDTQRLNRALVELAKAPRDLPALLEAGDAALSVGDLNAALGFFDRALEVEPSSNRSRLGLAKVYLQSGRPVTALGYFDQAEAGGVEPLAVGSDKALALDMVGDQRGAKTAYANLIEISPNDNEARRRLAISYAISGDLPSFETTLRPLIERRDFAAFRARAFGLAILGEQARAAAITDAVMPRELSQQITPYLEFMPRLTPAQQAAAASLGVFPRAADIGRDSAEVAGYANRYPATAVARPGIERSAVGSRLEPTGAQLGASSGELVREKPARVADAFGDMLAAEEGTGAVSQGAVDIAQIDVPREAPPEPVIPSRIWVQVATGRDVEALGFDWRRLARTAPSELGEFVPHTVRWGLTNRLLAGPVDTNDEARDLINALQKKGIDTFRYTSPEGQEIQVLKVP